MAKRAVASLVQPQYSPRYQTIAHQFLDIERDAGLEVTSLEYHTLDALLDEAQQRIKVSSTDKLFEATKALKTIDELLRETGFQHEDNVLLSEGLKEKTPKPITCLGRTAIYKAIAEILNLPIVAVSAPEHVFVRWHLKDMYINWETTLGKEVKDFLYVITHNIHEKSRENGVYLKSITRNEILTGHYHSSVGYTLRRKGKHQQALKHHLKAIELDSSYPEGFNNVGVVLTVSSKYAEALSYFIRALRLNPNSARAHYNCGCLYFRQENFEKAATYFMKALELNPDYREAKKGLELSVRKL